MKLDVARKKDLLLADLLEKRIQKIITGISKYMSKRAKIGNISEDILAVLGKAFCVCSAR